MIIAVFNIVCSLILVIWDALVIFVGVTVSIGISRWLKEESPNHGAEPGLAVIGAVLLTIGIIVLFAGLISLVAAIFLWIGANKGEISKCRIWFAVTIICTGLFILSRLIGIGNGIYEGTLGAVDITEELFIMAMAVAITAYELWIVHAFIDELKQKQMVVNLEASAPGTVVFSSKAPSY